MGLGYALCVYWRLILFLVQCINCEYYQKIRKEYEQLTCVSNVWPKDTIDEVLEKKNGLTKGRQKILESYLVTFCGVCG
jgi:hypothetical protein